MTIVPVLLDAQPRYLGGPTTSMSQLLCPVGETGLVAEIAAAASAVTRHAPFVLPSFDPDAWYLAFLRQYWAAIEGVLTDNAMRGLVARLDPSDELLLLSSSCVSSGELDLRDLVAPAGTGPARDRAPMVRHLLAVEGDTLRTQEVVQTDHDGRVRRIQRYFEPATWARPSGIVASLVPVSCLQMVPEVPLDSLLALRHVLTAAGFPSQDIPLHGDVFDLNDERGALALSEARLRIWADRSASRPARSPETPSLGEGASMHPAARIIGDVMVHRDAIIDDGALVIGPSVLGEGAYIARGAVVAQCLVLPGAVVAADATVLHRVVPARAFDGSTEGRTGSRRHGRSGGRRLADAPEVPRWFPMYTRFKRAAEPVIAGLTLVFLAPLLALIALLVKVTSPGPVFYGDLREGMDGTTFRCWKFRTMLPNANDMQRALQAEQQLDGPQFKMDVDPRVTPIGRWLRMLNVDELPQLWNVVRGDMSFVGPRPSPFRENQICVPWRLGRLSVRPGITGLWQVCRHDRALGDFHQWIQYDMLYVRHCSLIVDARILVYTILTLGGRRPVALSRVIGKAAVDGAAADTAAEPAVVSPAPRPAAVFLPLPRRPFTPPEGQGALPH